MIYFTSDFHLGDERQALLGRPFSNAHECCLELVARWNEVVSDKDIVYFVGDFCVKEDYLFWAKKLKGQKHLILGNYDNFTDRQYMDNSFLTVSDYKLIELPESYKNDVCDEHMNQIYIQHYPTRSIARYFNLVGHIHTAWKVQKNMLNIGVDCWHFFPVSMNQICFAYNAINKFYDNDVWVGNHPANVACINRGQKGTYWEKKDCGNIN